MMLTQRISVLAHDLANQCHINPVQVEVASDGKQRVPGSKPLRVKRSLLEHRMSQKGRGDGLDESRNCIDFSVLSILSSPFLKNFFLLQMSCTLPV